MVRLKDLDIAQMSNDYNNFNSTMVRLKEFAEGGEVKAPKFQFHYGTIKSTMRNFVKKSSTVFQFHYGTIKRASLQKEAASG